MRLIEQDPLCIGRPFENGTEQVASSAGDVRDGCKLREIVSWQDGGDIAVRFRCHRRVEDAALFRVVGQVRKNAASVSLGKRGFAGAQRVIQIFESAPKDRQTEHAGVIAERTGVIGSKEA